MTASVSRSTSAALVVAAGCLFIAGALLFSGTIYLYCLTGTKWFGPLTPIGGALLMAGNATLTPLTFMLAGVILGRVEYLRRAPAGPAVAPLGPGRGRVHVGAPGAAVPGMRTVL